jgi:hypothetical protein
MYRKFKELLYSMKNIDQQKTMKHNKIFRIYIKNVQFRWNNISH